VKQPRCTQDQPSLVPTGCLVLADISHGFCTIKKALSCFSIRFERVELSARFGAGLRAGDIVAEQSQKES
jgi:hypothetical protein